MFHSQIILSPIDRYLGCFKFFNTKSNATEQTSHFLSPTSELGSWQSTLTTGKKLKINNSSEIHQRSEVKGQTAAPKIGEMHTENYNLPEQKSMSRNFHENPCWVRKPEL